MIPSSPPVFRPSRSAVACNALSWRSSRARSMPAPNASTSSSSDTPPGPLAAEQLAQEVLARQAELAGRAVERRERRALGALDARRPLARRARIRDVARAEAAPAERQVDGDEQRRHGDRARHRDRQASARAAVRRRRSARRARRRPTRARPTNAAPAASSAISAAMRNERLKASVAPRSSSSSSSSCSRVDDRPVGGGDRRPRERRVEVGQLLVAGLLHLRCRARARGRSSPPAAAARRARATGRRARRAGARSPDRR